ncbi:MAG: urease accessory protein UreE [Rhizobiales bacterium 32-66-8]|nr:MAG: urease accessory protein UreE [Rhizobiales bacterium 32-66-8]
MVRASRIIRHLAVRAERVVDTITLDYQARHRRRVTLTTDSGAQFLLDLDRATVLDDGDALELETGDLIRVKAAEEKLLEVTTYNPLRLMRAGWHLGNRHVPTELTDGALYVCEDPVIDEMLRGLGASTVSVKRPFRPERGAYEAAQAHGHGVAADDGDAADGHAHAGHAHAGHDHGHDHAHGDDCGCGASHAKHG